MSSSRIFVSETFTNLTRNVLSISGSLKGSSVGANSGLCRASHHSSNFKAGPASLEKILAAVTDAIIDLSHQAPPLFEITDRLAQFATRKIATDVYHSFFPKPVQEVRRKMGLKTDEVL